MPRDDRAGKGAVLGAAAAVVGALSMGLIFAPPAAASWSPAVGVSASGWQGQDSPMVAVDRQGDSLLVWAACQTGASGCYFQVKARIKRRGSPVGPIRTLSPLGADSAWPQVASDDDGDSAVVWQQDSHVMGRRISASGSVGVLRTLSSAGTVGINPSVVVTPAGRALAVWTEIRSGSYYTVARYFYKDGSLGRIMTLGGSSGDGAAAGIDRLGMAVVSWADSSQRVVASRLKPGYTSPLRVIMPAVAGIGYGRVSVGDDRDGDAVISFLRSDNTNVGEFPHVWARRWTRTGTLGSILHVSPSSDNATFYSALATDLAGDSTILWSRWANSGQTDVFGRRISATGRLGPISHLGIGDRPEVAVDDDGNGLAVWQSPGVTSGPSKVDARKVWRSGGFGTLAQLSSDGRVIRTAASPWGRFTATWQQSSFPYQIKARLGP